MLLTALGLTALAGLLIYGAQYLFKSSDATKPPVQSNPPERNVRIKLGDFCFHSSDCSEYYSECLSERCKCKAGYFQHINGFCSPYATHINDSCIFGATACESIPNSNCVESKCVCNSKHFEKDEKCVPGLDAPCIDSLDCGLDNSECLAGICQCSTGYFDDSGGHCLNYAANLYDSCQLMANQCDSIQNSECNAGECICQSTHIDQDGKCLPGLGAPCNNSSDCAVQNSECSSGECRCGDGHFQDPIAKRCIEYASKINDSCETLASQCNSIPNSFCYEGGCICQSGYEDNNGLCAFKLDVPCSDSSECTPRNSECSSGTCQCGAEHVYDLGECVKYASGPGDFCKSSRTCQNVRNSWCSNEKCTCTWGSSDDNLSCRSSAESED